MKNLLTHLNEILASIGVVASGIAGFFVWKRKSKKDKIELKISVDKLYEERIIELARVNQELHESYFNKSSEAAKYRLLLVQLPVDCPECAECIKKITDRL
jgi:hypothetical protein